MHSHRKVRNFDPRLLVLAGTIIAASLAVGCDSKEKSAPRQSGAKVSSQAGASATSAAASAAAPSSKPAPAVPSSSAKATAPASGDAANEKEEPKAEAPSPAAALQKLDAHLQAALKKGRTAPAPDQPLTLDPDIPIQDGERVLVDIKGSFSKDLADQVTRLGGTVVSGAETPGTLRAMVPFAQLTALAGRPDVESISPGTLTITGTAPPK